MFSFLSLLSFPRMNLVIHASFIHLYGALAEIYIYIYIFVVVNSMLVTIVKHKLSICGFPFSHFLCFRVSNKLKLVEKKRKKQKNEKLHHKIMFPIN